MKKLLFINIGILLFWNCRNVVTSIQNNTYANKTTNVRNAYKKVKKRKIKEIVKDYIKLEICECTNHFNVDTNKFLETLFEEIYDGKNQIYANYSFESNMHKELLEFARKLIRKKFKELQQKLKNQKKYLLIKLNKIKPSFLDSIKYFFYKDKKVNKEVQKGVLIQQEKVIKDSMKKIDNFTRMVEFNLQNSIYNYGDFIDLNNSYLMKNFFIQNKKNDRKVNENNIDLKKIGFQIISNIKNNKKVFRVITMTGPPGVGKTYLAECVMNDLDNNGYSKKYIYIDQSDKLEYKDNRLILKRECGEIEEIKFNKISLLVWDDTAFMDPESVNKDQQLKKDHKDLYMLIKILELCKENNTTLYISSNSDNLRGYFKKCISNKIINNKQEVALIKPFLQYNNLEKTSVKIEPNIKNYLLKNLNLPGVRKGIINYFANNKIYHDTNMPETKKIFNKLIYTFIKDKSVHNTNGGVVYLPIDWYKSLIKKTYKQEESITIEIEEENKEEIAKIKKLSNNIKVIKYDYTNRYSITIPLNFLKKRIDIIDTSKKLYIDRHNNKMRLYIKEKPIFTAGIGLVAKAFVRNLKINKSYNNLSYDRFHSTLKSTKNNYCRVLPELSRNNFNKKKLSLVLFDRTTSHYLSNSNEKKSINSRYAKVVNNFCCGKKNNKIGQAKSEVCSTVLDPFETFLYGTKLYSANKRSFLAGYSSRLKCSTIIFNNDKDINDSELSLLYSGAKIKKRYSFFGNPMLYCKMCIASALNIGITYYFLSSTVSSLLINFTSINSAPIALISVLVAVCIAPFAFIFVHKYIVSKFIPQINSHCPSWTETVFTMAAASPISLVLSGFIPIPLMVSGSISVVLLLLSGISMFFK